MRQSFQKNIKNHLKNIIVLLQLLNSHVYIKTQPDPYLFPTQDSYPFKLVASPPISTRNLVLSYSGYVTKNIQGDKVMVAMVFGGGFPFFYRCIVPANGDNVQLITQQNNAFSGNSGRALIISKKLNKIVLTNHFSATTVRIASFEIETSKTSTNVIK